MVMMKKRTWMTVAPAAEKTKNRLARLGKSKGRIPLVGLVVAAGILLASAGGTYFFPVTPARKRQAALRRSKGAGKRPVCFCPENSRTSNGDQAWRPEDSNESCQGLRRHRPGRKGMELHLAGSTIRTCSFNRPQLTSDLAKYYEQRNQYSRAAELLRPLAGQNIPHKKAELADLDALWETNVLTRVTQSRRKNAGKR